MKILVEESVLRQALDELCTQRDAHYSGDYPTELRESITALRETLDAAEKVEPVAFIQRTMVEQFGEWVEVFDLNMSGNGEPLYTHPAPTVPEVGADKTGEKA